MSAASLMAADSSWMPMHPLHPAPWPTQPCSSSTQGLMPVPHQTRATRNMRFFQIAHRCSSQMAQPDCRGAPTWS